MKKVIIAGMAVIFSLLAYNASAEEYAVRKGDCLSVVGKQLGVPWRKIAKASKVKGPKYTIYIGQKLNIPRETVKAATVQTTTVKTVTVPESTQYLEKINLLQTQISELKQKLNEATALAAKKEKTSTQVAAVTTEVQTSISTVQETRDETATEAEAAVAKTTVKGETEAAESQKTDSKLVATAFTPVVSESKKSASANDQFDWFMIKGGWRSQDNKTVNQGDTYQTKIRYRPFSFNAFGHDVGVGGFFIGETGSGSSGASDFRWNKLTLGPTAKVYGNHWNAVTELGWSGQWDYGANDKQTTYSGYLLQYLNLEQRRAAKKKAFPQTELVGYFTAPYESSKESTKPGKTMGMSLAPTNKAVMGLEIRQSLYDFDLSDHLTLAPGLMAGGGLEATAPFGKIGPFAKLRSYDQDIIIADINLKDVSGVQGYRSYYSVNLVLSGVINAIKAAGITEAEAADLTVKR